MDKFKVTLGSIELNIVDFVINEKLNDMPKATFKIHKSDWLSLPPLNLLEDVVMINLKTQKRQFAGNIKTIEKIDDHVILNLENGVEFSDTYMTGLQTRMTTQESVYAMCRMSGLSDDRINIQGFINSEKIYAVFIPVIGLNINTKTTYGNFTLMNTDQFQSSIPTDQSSELWKELLVSDGLLSFTIKSNNFYDAELLAMERADAFLTQYSLMLQFPYSKFNAELNLWDRKRQFLHLERKDFALLVQEKTGYTWLHDLTEYNPVQEHDLPSINFDYENNIKAVDSMTASLIIWNRFRNSNDYLLVTVGFWQVIELLCSDVKLPKRFKPSEIKSLKAKLSELSELDEKEQNSLNIALEKINARSLDDKFKEFISRHSIDLTDDDSKVIGKFRTIRNGIEHGKKYVVPTTMEILRLKSILNYILIMSFAK